jgi:hypothetical protein
MQPELSGAQHAPRQPAAQSEPSPRYVPPNGSSSQAACERFASQDPSSRQQPPLVCAATGDSGAATNIGAPARAIRISSRERHRVHRWDAEFAIEAPPRMRLAVGWTVAVRRRSGRG